MNAAEYTDADATQLAAWVASGEVSPSELVEAAIAAIERVNPRLDALVYRLFDEARAAAAADDLPAGPLRGVPLVIKDFDGFVKGVPFTAGCRFMDGFRPDHDSLAMARLRGTGAIFMATTKCPELAIMGTTEPEFRGPAHNPYDLSRSTGGSSGGSAALVAARAVPIGHGGDGGGSLRIPANHCGLVGFKASRGRIPVGPDQGEGWGGYVQWGAVTRSVRDTAAVLDAMAGPSPGDLYAAAPLPGPLCAEVGRDPGRLRVAFFDGSLFGRETAASHRDAVRAVAGQLAALGHDVHEARPPIDAARLTQAYFTQVSVGIAEEIESFSKLTGRRPRPDLFEPSTWFLNLLGRSQTGLELLEARNAAAEASAVMGAFHQQYDVFLTATVTHPQVELGALALGQGERIGLRVLRHLPSARILKRINDQLAPAILELTPNTQLFNQTGQPAVSLPLARTDSGLPIGAQLAAPLGREDLLMRLAGQLEAEHPWADIRPEVCG